MISFHMHALLRIFNTIAFCCYSASIFALGLPSSAPQSNLNFFTHKAVQFKLYKNLEWEKILFYQKKYFTGKRGIVDGAQFYLSPHGRQDPKAEMLATIKSFYSGKQGDNAPQCLFPRRLKWLKKQLDTNEFKIPTSDCPKLNQWLQLINPKGVALVFSSFYINNPSSMFGHTFLRIMNSDYSLTNFGVNYAANPDTNNMISYVFKGLTGMFEGKFSILPYSVKVQEYNNSESRDLYEYELNISQPQTLNMMLSLWEVGDNPINYYYIDENCSYILLALLDTVNPNYNFTDKFMLFVNPADTLRVINEIPNFVKNATVRPSSEHRFKMRYDDLNKKEKEIFSKIMDEELLPYNISNNLEKENAAKILTAVSEYIDYKEHIAGTGEPEKYPALRNKVLRARAQLGIISPPLDLKVAKEEFPENGVYGSRIGSFYNYSTQTKNSLHFEFRPVLHDISSPAQGYSPEAQIELANTVLTYEAQSRSVYLNEFSLIHIFSLPSLNPPLYPVSWGLQAAVKEDEDCKTGLYTYDCERYFMSGLAGISLRKGPLQIYFLPNLQFSYMNNFGFESLMGATAGFLLRPTGNLTIHTSAEILKRFSMTQNIWRWHQTMESSLALNLAKEIECKTYLSYNFQHTTWNFGTGLYWYFY